MHGFGTLYYTNGQIAYEGQWFEDKFNGRGTVYNENPESLSEDFDYKNFDHLGDYWLKYEGQFVDDMKNGFGILYLTNGDRFEGNFKGDMIHGRGTYYFLHGQQANGEWLNNRLA